MSRPDGHRTTADVVAVPRDAEGETPPAPLGRQPRPVRVAQRPRSVIGTPASAGPYAKLRVNIVDRYQQGYAAWRLIVIGNTPVRAAAAQLGLSPTTAWRRAWWFNDVDLNRRYGFPPGPPPHQRGTRAVPRGRPYVLPMDAPYVIAELCGLGYSLEDIAVSVRTVPACVRRLARRMAARNDAGRA